MGYSLQFLYKIIHGCVFRIGAAFQVLQTAGCFNHLKLRAAAAVAVAEGNQPLRKGLLAGNVILVADALNPFQKSGGIGPGVNDEEMGIDTGTVDSPPYKGFVGESVGIVPGKLGGQKTRHPKPSHNLGQCGAVAKGIREPECLLRCAKPAADVPGSPQELTYQAFTGGNIAVAFDPYRTVELKPALCHPALQLLKNLGIVLLHQPGVIGGALNESILRVLIHQIKLVGSGAGNLLGCFFQRPQPRCVNVAVPNQRRRGGAGAVAAGKCRRHDAAGFGKRRKPGACIHSLRVIVENGMHLGQNIQKFRTAEGDVGQLLHQLQQHTQIENKIQNRLIFGADGDLLGGKSEIPMHPPLKGLFTHHIVTGVKFNRQGNGCARRCGGADAVTVVVAVSGDDDFRCIGSIGLPIHPKHGFVAAQLRVQIQGLPSQLLRRCVLCQKPAVAPFTAPFKSGWALRGRGKQGCFRDFFQPFGSFVHDKRELCDFGEYVRFKHFHRTAQFGKKLSVLSVVQH